MGKYFFTCVLALAAACAQAGVGLTQLPAANGDGPVTVFYPADGTDAALKRGPFTIKALQDAPPVRGNGRLVMISHGSGGNPWVHSDLARTLVEAGFTVAMPQHRGDNATDPSHPGPDSWRLRPAEVSRAIDAVSRDPRFAPLLSLDKVGMYGMSAGGHTALSLAGGRWSPAAYRDHCVTNIAEDFPTCVGLSARLRGDALDGVKKAVATGVIRERYDDATWYVHRDPRIRAIVAGVPAAADFDPASLASPAVPLGFVTARKDKWLNPRFHSDRILAVCKTCTVIADLPDGGHGALLSPPPPIDVMGEIAQDLLGDPPGFDRSAMPAVDRKIAAFFSRHLVP
ncbi:alpha/beta hydrolase family protein [Caenimonas aquaedulcis]|uniref:Dienelactone hydrolase n=1 Tax=Caenimonas aquaedulcis TaxID=2793270 RepID=A0A931H390_9BURK|nr:dienelactone hydrolase [Caenimonas aquaedulcis]MBG9387734.1 dienelactone hydrolase [Caenimonas aquaedulcis]